ncbi:MAG TPA: DUF6776 family protein [Gammaproteobacteria bacterium]
MIFEYGRQRGGYDSVQARQDIEMLSEQISILDARIDELMSENAQLASSSEIDATASKQVSENLSELNDEMLELKEELVFYRSLLSPAELQPGLQILGIQMIKDGGSNAYNYKIVLTQRHNGSQLATGDVNVQLNGIQAGTKTQLDLMEVTASRDNEMSFHFKNFQSLEGRLVLPEGFQPKDILVNVNPTTRGIKQIERTYDWNTIVSGG